MPYLKSTQCSITFSISNGTRYCPTMTILEMCILCGPNATHSFSMANNNSSSSWCQICGGWFIGVCCKVASFRGQPWGVHTTIARDTWLTYISLAARSSALGSLVSFNIDIFGSSATYILSTCTPATWNIAARHLVVWQLAAWQFYIWFTRNLGITTASHLTGRQLGRLQLGNVNNNVVLYAALLGIMPSNAQRRDEKHQCSSLRTFL
jgi:hypothetical protein